jgi:hypothetical protein
MPAQGEASEAIRGRALPPALQQALHIRMLGSMARIRTIKPEFHANERLSALSAETHLLACALLNYADDEGFFNSNPQLVKAACCPLRELSKPIAESLRELEQIGYFKSFDGTDGRQYGWIVNFRTHQNINRPKDSKIKTLLVVTDESLMRHLWNGDQGMDQGSGNGEQGGGEHDASPQPIMLFPVVASQSKPSEWPLLPAKLQQYRESYPAVDVLQECRNARQWCIDNKAKRKTYDGMSAFLTRWLQKEQNRGGGKPSVPKSRSIPKISEG